MLCNFQCQGFVNLKVVEQGPAVLAAGAGWELLDFLTILLLDFF